MKSIQDAEDNGRGDSGGQENRSKLSNNNSELGELMKKFQKLSEMISKDSSSSSTSSSSSSSEHNRRLTTVLRTILKLSEDFEKNYENDSTLVQLLHTISDYFDKSSRDLNLTKNDLHSQQNNLQQENLKLRKLLQLQQKAIAFRTSNTFDSNSNPNFGGFQCFYCPKIFSDIGSFSKHISLRHLVAGFEKTTSELESWNNNNLDNPQTKEPSRALFIEYLQQRIPENFPNSINTPGTFPAAADPKVQPVAAAAFESSLQSEIQSLKRKLSETQSQLNQEQLARENFQKNLQNDFREKVTEIQQQLLASIGDEILLERQRKSLPSSSLPEETHKKLPETFPEDQKVPEKVPEKVPAPQQQHKPIIMNLGRKNFVGDSLADSLKLPRALPPPSTKTMTTMDDNSMDSLKQSMKEQLISQIIQSKHSDSVPDSGPQLAKNPKSKSKNRHKIISQPAPEPEPEPEQSKESTKAEIYSSIENRLKSYLDSGTSKVKDHQDLEDQKDDDDNDDDGESRFSNAMEKFQRDRNLVIHQSRYDYDFLEIESRIRGLIDQKLESKLRQQTGTEEETFRETSIQENLPVIEFPDDNEEDEDEDDDDDDNEVIDVQDDDSKEPSSPTIVLKSILKKKIIVDGGQDKEPSAAAGQQQQRRITFNNQLTEYEISPLQSDDNYDDDDHDDDHDGPGGGQMFMINDNHHGGTFDGENIFVNELSTSSSSSSEDDEDSQVEVVATSKKNQPDDNPPPSTIITNNQSMVIDVDVHHDPPPPLPPQPPVPASRTSTNSARPTSLSLANSTLNSLLVDHEDQDHVEVTRKVDHVHDNDNEDDDDEEQFRSKTLRVTELAELIEKKLQTRRRLSQQQGNTEDHENHRKLPPIGSVNTVGNFEKVSGNSLKKIENSAAEDDDYDIYDF